VRLRRMSNRPEQGKTYVRKWYKKQQGFLDA
jgi:hypothetical protein